MKAKERVLMNYFKSLYNGKKYKKQYTTLLWGYIIIALVVMLINIIGHSVISIVTKTEIYGANSRFVHQMKTICDEAIENSILSASKMINTDSVKILSRFDDYDKPYYSDHVKAVIKELEIVVNSNKAITNGYLIFKNKDLCVSNSTKLNYQLLYEMVFNDYYSSAEEMKKDFYSDNLKDIRILKGKKENKLMLFYNFSNGAHVLNGEKSNVGVILEITPGNIIKMQDTHLMGEFVLVINNSEVLLAKEDIDFQKLIAENRVEFVHNDKKYILTVSESDMFDGKYVHYTEKTLYEKSVNTINNIITIVFLLCLLVGVRIAFIFTKKNYISVSRMLDKIELDAKNAKKQDEEIQNLYLANIVSGRQKADKMQVDKYFSEIKYSHFCVVLFNILDFAVEDDRDHNTTLFSVSNVFSELVSDFAVVRFITVDGFYVCVLNFKMNDGYKELIDSKIVETNQFVSNHLGITFNYYISDATTALDEISFLYNQCRECVSNECIFAVDAEAVSENDIGVDERCARIIEYIENNYSDGNLGVKTIADEFGLSFNYISKYFKEHTGDGLAKYIIYKRIEKAKELMVDTNDSITKIADKTGFYSANVFIRTFKKVVGITPGKYRENYKYNTNK